MTIDPASMSRAHESQLSLEQLAVNPNVSDADKIAEASRQFEAVLLRQILADVNKPDDDDNPAVAGIYSDMVNTQLADAISRSGECGLAQSLETQLGRQLLPHPVSHTKTPAATPPAETTAKIARK